MGEGVMEINLYFHCGMCADAGQLDKEVLEAGINAGATHIIVRCMTHDAVVGTFALHPDVTARLANAQCAKCSAGVQHQH